MFVFQGCDERKDTEPWKPKESYRDVREKRQEDRNTSKGKSRVKFNDLDPMDPASYSDIPR
jgi:polyglutamine-binding protein 1